MNTSSVSTSSNNNRNNHRQPPHHRQLVQELDSDLEDQDDEDIDSDEEKKGEEEVRQNNPNNPKAVPFKVGHLQIPIHGMGEASGNAQYCFLCATSNDASTNRTNAVSNPDDGYEQVNEQTLRIRQLALSKDYDQLLNMITTNVGRMDEDCLIRAIQTFYDSSLKPHVPDTPDWHLRVIREHIRDHEINAQWQAWTAASDLRTLIRINLNNGVCVKDDDSTNQKLDIPRVKLHIQLLRQLEREVSKATASTT
jgi:hypothetical protein